MKNEREIWTCGFLLSFHSSKWIATAFRPLSRSRPNLLSTGEYHVRQRLHHALIYAPFAETRFASGSWKKICVLRSDDISRRIGQPSLFLSPTTCSSTRSSLRLHMFGPACCSSWRVDNLIPKKRPANRPGWLQDDLRATAVKNYSSPKSYSEKPSSAGGRIRFSTPHDISFNRRFRVVICRLSSNGELHPGPSLNVRI